MSLNGVDQGFPTWETRPPRGTREAGSGDASLLSQLGLGLTRPAWAGFKTAEEGRTKIM